MAKLCNMAGFGEDFSGKVKKSPIDMKRGDGNENSVRNEDPIRAILDTIIDYPFL